MTSRTATLHRMVLPDHECPFGVSAKGRTRYATSEALEEFLASAPAD